MLSESSRARVWLQAFRLHTLPLALAAIGLGSALGTFDTLDWNAHWPVTVLALLTAISLQILSNLANDYGDAQNGADTDKRIGPQRVTAAGLVTVQSIRKGILFFAILSLFCGVGLILAALPTIGIRGAMILFGLGVVAIIAAVAYTATSIPYGYRGYGDLSVWLFFGLLAVGGAYYLHTGRLPLSVALVAGGMGMLCTAVLNVNNLRDLETDASAGKITVALRLGIRRGKIYHILLISLGLGATALYGYLRYGQNSNIGDLWKYTFAACAIGAFPLIRSALNVAMADTAPEMGKALKGTVLGILMYTMIYIICIFLIALNESVYSVTV